MNTQRKIAQHLIANNNCAGITCTGVGGLFHGTACPLDSDVEPCPYATMKGGLSILQAASSWVIENNLELVKKVESPAPSQTMPTCEILDFLPSGSNEKTPNDKLELLTEADILLDIIANGDCNNIHCDGVDVEPWVCNIGTPCPIMNTCPIYINRNSTTPTPTATMYNFRRQIVEMAKVILLKLSEYEVQLGLARIIIQNKGCKNISCNGIESNDPTGEVLLNDSILCPLYGDGDEDNPNNCPLAVFGDYSATPYAAKAWIAEATTAHHALTGG